MGKCKEEDRIEKLIRGLLKLPDNRRCINCNSLGPQYVCTTFWTFVCTSCSGVHREFTHRVKSVSMAKFTLEEVSALQAGGNERARQIYFKMWDQQRNFFPDNSSIHILRDFIKHVYVDKRYTGESHPTLNPRLRKSEKDEPFESRTVSSEKSRFHERNVDRFSRYSYDEVRSPEYTRENSRYRGSRNGSSRFEATEGRYQVDVARIVGRSATQMFTTDDIKPKMRSPDRCRRDMNSSPPVRHVREIFGENFLPLRVGDNPKSSERRSAHAAANGQKIGYNSKVGISCVDGNHGQEGFMQQSCDHSKTNHRRSISACSQTNAQSRSQISVGDAAVKPKSGSAGSLVDFATSSPDASIQNQVQEMHVINAGGKSGSSDQPVKDIACSAPPKNTLEFLLFELSTPSDITPRVGVPRVDDAATCAPSSTLEVVPTLPSNGDDSFRAASVLTSTNTPIASAASATTFSSAMSVSTSTIKSAISNNSDAAEVAFPQSFPDLLGDDIASKMEDEKNQCPGILQSEHSVVPVSHGISFAPQGCHLDQFTNNQPEKITPVQCAEAAFDNSAREPHADQSSAQQTSAVRIHPSSAEARSVGRMELPASLFTSHYPSGPSDPVLVPGWQTSPSYGMGLNMQYHPASMQIPTFPNMVKSTNPFDTNDNTAQSHAPMFPSMTSLQGGLPSMSTPPGILQASSFGSHVRGFPPTQPPSYLSGAYVAQNLYGNMPSSGQEGIGGFSREAGMPVSLDLNQQNPFTYEAPSSQSSFPTGVGNPFG